MKGGIIGDIIGSVFERAPVKEEGFDLFSLDCRVTDDSVLTVATAYALLNKIDYSSAYKFWANKYPNAGYGGLFSDWMLSVSLTPYNSWGNGGAMRVSPIAWAFNSLKEVEAEAMRSASVTHNHPEGIKGAQAVAASVFLARTGVNKPDIKRYVEERFRYDLSKDYETVRKSHSFDISAQGSVPQAIIAFLAGNSFESCVRKAVALGGDSDTQACIAGAIAQAFYKEIPRHILIKAHPAIPGDLFDVIVAFNKKFNVNIKAI